MTIRFVRIAGEKDRIYVKRSDGTELSWTFPSFGNEIPHDMVHLVVEKYFGLREGFWGRVDRGVDPKIVNQQANREGGKDKYAGFGEDLSELYLAETLAALASGYRDPAKFPEGVTETSFADVDRELYDLRVQWRSLLPKGTIELTFP